MEKSEIFNQKRVEALNPFMKYCGMEFTLSEKDHARLRLEIRPEHKNPFGFVHGGVLSTMADNCTGAACHTDGRFYVTQSGSLNFLANQQEGTLQAEAWVRHRGGSTCLVDVDITGKDGKLLATGTYTLFCVYDPKKAGK